MQRPYDEAVLYRYDALILCVTGRYSASLKIHIILSMVITGSAMGWLSRMMTVCRYRPVIIFITTDRNSRSSGRGVKS